MAAAFSYCWGLSALLLGTIAISPGLAQTMPIEQQLNMQRHNFERARAQKTAERLLEEGDRSLAFDNEARAIAAWQEAFAIFSRIGNQAGMTQAIEPLAATLVAAERFDDAATVLHQQLTLAREQGDQVTQLQALNNLGMVYLQAGEIARGEAAINVALKLAEELANDAGIGLSLSNLGLAARWSGDLVSAQSYYESAVDYRTAASDWLGLAHTSNNLGEIYRQLDADEEALSAFLVARQAAQMAGDRATLFTALDGIIAIAADYGDGDILQPAVTERTAVSVFELPMAQRLGFHLAWARYYEFQEDYAEAQAAYEAGLAIAEDIDAAAQRTFILNQLQELALATEES
ncbi:MAG: tetratricopeptide repeat protein [Cyanobacteria bacterium P01_C01_bin.120]